MKSNKIASIAILSTVLTLLLPISVQSFFVSDEDAETSGCITWFVVPETLENGSRPCKASDFDKWPRENRELVAAIRDRINQLLDINTKN